MECECKGKKCDSSKGCNCGRKHYDNLETKKQILIKKKKREVD